MIHSWGCEVGRVEDEPVFLRLRSARPGSDVVHDGKEVVEAAEPVINFTVMPFNTWQVVKLRIKEVWPGLKHVPDSHVRLLYRGVELRGGSMVDDYQMEGGDKDQPVELEYLVIDTRGLGPADNHFGLYVSSQVPCTQTLRDALFHVKAAMLNGIVPRLTPDGTGATYMMLDTRTRRPLAVFKPKDEEAFAPQNPRGYVGRENSAGLRHGVLSAQQAAREVAAHLIDHGKFAKVPDTTLVHGKHPQFVNLKGKVVWKIGAFQLFVEHDGTVADFATQSFSDAEVHRIGILDIRIINLDRNDGNLLVRRAKRELVPIDHGLSLPDRLEVFAEDVAWMSWPQAKKPFGTEELTFIKELSGTRDAGLISKHLGIRRECLRLMEVATKLLQLGAEHGLTLYEIGRIMYRDDPHDDSPAQPSALEKIIEQSVDVSVVTAATRSVASSISTALSGLDLQVSRPPVQLSPMYTSASPVASSLLPDLSLPPHLPCSESADHENRAFSSVLSALSPALSASPGLHRGQSCEIWELDDSPTEGPSVRPRSSTAALRRALVAKPRSSGSKHRTTACLNCNSEPEGGDGHGIFSRYGLSERDWTVELELAFKKHVIAEITHHIKRHSGKRERDRLDAEAAVAATEHVVKDTSVASALPLVMPTDCVPTQVAEKQKSFQCPPHAESITCNLATTELGNGTASNSQGTVPAVLSSIEEVGSKHPAFDEPSQPSMCVGAMMRAGHSQAVFRDSERAIASEGASGTSSPSGTRFNSKESLHPGEDAGGNHRYGYCLNPGPCAYMEDRVSFFEWPDSDVQLYAVCDGHGGTAAVEFIIQRLPLAIRNHPSFDDPHQVQAVLRDAFEVTEKELLEHLRTNCKPWQSGERDREDSDQPLFKTRSVMDTGCSGTAMSAGCVCSVAIIRGKKIHVANLGDCRVLLCCCGELVPLTVDHRADTNEHERSRLEGLGVEVSSDGYLHGRISVSRAFGDLTWASDEKCRGLLCEPELSEEEVGVEAEFMLIGCDGIFEKMDSKSAMKIVRQALRTSGGDGKAAAEALVRFAIKLNGFDNLSAIVVPFKVPPPSDTGRTAPRLFGPRARVT